MAKSLSQKRLPLLAAILLAIVLGGNAALAQSSQTSLIQFIRQMIGIDRDIAAGGSRGSESQSICLITPRTEINSDGEYIAAALVPMPTLLTAEPLNELRIYREAFGLGESHLQLLPSKGQSIGLSSLLSQKKN